ncbi:LacI family DNA-binding transcriptional regulator [Duganella sp. Leaf126]|uniref:LacI family DNA-binding transcriptional regulator n=1 Tax=Duganella sp. Leaf126 TaxID=1736266 RepID=UPI001E2CC637|nr:LacI family DNA-binding transcriptional regulator [Duganella sp. Leaf126]
MHDVARLAGVSPMTVSRVMNGKDTVHARTRKKVADAAAALNYMPNQEARKLAGARPIRIGFLYSNPSAGYLSALLVGLLNQSSIHNMQLFVEKGDDQAHQLEQIERLIDNNLDGIVLPPPLGDDPAILARLNSAGAPVVTVACGQPEADVSSVSIDDYLAAFQMTRQLIGLGHQRIGFIAGDGNQIASARRLAGYQAALQEAGAQIAQELVVPGLYTYRSGLEAAETLLALAERPSAIFASNDDMAAATVAVAHRLGMDVPGDLTVVGFDDTALATTIWPALTTVHQPITDMAGEAVRLLQRQIRSRRDGAPLHPEHVLMNFSLVRRQSDAAPRVRPPARYLPPQAPRPVDAATLLFSPPSA